MNQLKWTVVLCALVLSSVVFAQGRGVVVPGQLGTYYQNGKTYSFNLLPARGGQFDTASLVVRDRFGSLRREPIRGEWTPGNVFGMVELTTGDIFTAGVARTGTLWHFEIDQWDNVSELGNLWKPMDHVWLSRIVKIARVPVPGRFRGQYRWNMMVIVSDTNGRQWCRTRFINWQGNEPQRGLNTGWASAEYCRSKYSGRVNPRPIPTPRPRPNPRPIPIPRPNPSKVLLGETPDFPKFSARTHSLTVNARTRLSGLEIHAKDDSLIVSNVTVFYRGGEREVISGQRLSGDRNSNTLTIFENRSEYLHLERSFSSAVRIEITASSPLFGTEGKALVYAIQ